MTLAFDPESHTYRVDGRVVPHVTGIIKPLVRLWTNGADLERARQEGRATHKMVELECLGEDYDCPTWLLGYREAWRKFVAQTGFVLLRSEMQAYSEKFGFAGSLDLDGILTKIKGEPKALIDIKRSAADAPAVGVQLAGYELLLGQPRKRFGLKLMGSGEYRLARHEDPQDRAVFLACLTLHRYREKNP